MQSLLASLVRTAMVIVALTSIPRPAHAQSPSATAKQLYDEGLTNYNLGHYEQALNSFEMGYRLRHDPAFLFNIGQCQRQLHRYEDAERSYRAYLRESPDLPNTTHEQVQKLVAEMERAVEAERAKQPPTGTQPPVTTTAESQPVQSQTTEVHAVAEPSSRWFTSKTGWALSSAGIVLAGVSAGLLGAAASEHNAALSATTQAAFDDHHANTIRFQQAGWPLLGVGGALVIAGVTVFALHAKGR